MIKGYQEFMDGKSEEWEGIKVIDDHTLQFELSYPFAPLRLRIGLQLLHGGT